MSTTIGKFISKYGAEALSIAEALTNVMEGLALKPSEAAKVRETIEKLEQAAENIAKSDLNINVKINKSDIEVAVKSYLDTNLKPIVVAYIEEQKANEENNSGTGNQS